MRSLPRSEAVFLSILYMRNADWPGMLTTTLFVQAQAAAVASVTAGPNAATAFAAAVAQSTAVSQCLNGSPPPPALQILPGFSLASALGSLGLSSTDPKSDYSSPSLASATAAVSVLGWISF